MHHSDKDPIIAPPTAAGRGGIGILRLSFGKALEAQIVGRLFGENCTLKARYAHLLPFLGTDGGVLDRAIVLLFPAPHSYTGESVLEIQAHGGPVLLSLIMRTCLEKCRDLGLRMAEPGEFTRRAFMNGRMDLTQAEAVADLIDAVSESAVQAAGRSLSGEFSNAVRDVDGNITELRAFIEATLDFPEEDIDVIGSEKVRTRLVQAETGIRAILENARQGQVLREGVTVAIVGSPNVGKSSLLNALAQEEVAIVTDIPGTTRDRIEHWVSLNGVPVKMVDTAGIRTTDDVVESKGIERTLVEIRKADVVLHLKDASGLIRDDTEVLDKVLKEVRHGVPLITVNNKVDLCESAASGGEIAISAKQGVGLSELKARLLEVVGMAATTDGVFMARERHLQCLKTAAEHVSRALLLIDCDPMPELVAEELRLASRALGEILGETTTEDILGMIFSKFCIGK